jgi:hypothetical protein
VILTRFKCSFVIFTRFKCSFVIYTRFECSFVIYTRLECSFSMDDFIDDVDDYDEDAPKLIGYAGQKNEGSLHWFRV